VPARLVPLLPKMRGMAMVSACSVVVSQVMLFVLATLWPPAVANVAVVTATSMPAYAANRRWVWRAEGRRGGGAGFVAQNLVGLVVSTVAVASAARTVHTSWAVNLASVAAWVTLWPISFLLNDRVWFRS
jgi:putative flippase GtrA